MPLTIGVWLSVPIITSGTAHCCPSRCSVVTTVASCSRLMVCMIPVPGGWMRTPASEPRGPAQEAIALGVAPQLVPQVDRRRIGSRIRLDGERMVDRDVHRQRRVQRRRIEAMLGQRITHRRDVHQRGRARGVVHQHAAGLEGDLGLAGSGRRPREDRRHRIVPLRTALAAQHVLEQDSQHHRQPAQALAKKSRQIDKRERLAVYVDLAGGHLGGLVGVFHDRHFAFCLHKMQSCKPSCATGDAWACWAPSAESPTCEFATMTSDN